MEKFNTKDGNCVVCFQPLIQNTKRFGIDYELNVAVKHHITYFPEKVTWVHQKCHTKIHDPQNPLTHLIQYDNGDSEKFYANKNA